MSNTISVIMECECPRVNHQHPDGCLTRAATAVDLAAHILGRRLRVCEPCAVEISGWCDRVAWSYAYLTQRRQRGVRA